MAKYLIQRGTGKIFHSTPILAVRRDMTEYDPETAERRIKALQTRLEDMKGAKFDLPKDADELGDKARQDGKTIANLEGAIIDREKEIVKETTGVDPDEDVVKKSDEEIETERQEKLIEEDPEISKIHQMTAKKEVTDYALEEFGQVIDGSLKELKKQAVALRTERLLER